MWDEFIRRQEVAAQSSDSSSEDDEQMEAKFTDLEDKQREWHISLDHSKWHTVYVTKKMVSDGIILCNEYNVDRYVYQQYRFTVFILIKAPEKNNYNASWRLVLERNWRL